jgi:threonine/homoserine/homoserine lactone efflux protein
VPTPIRTTVVACQPTAAATWVFTNPSALSRPAGVPAWCQHVRASQSSEAGRVGKPGSWLATGRYREAVRSVPEFLLVALVVTLTPGPATATIIRVAARDGRGAALSAIFGNSIGVFVWGCLSAVGVASLVTASEVAYTALRLGGALVLIVLGARSLLHREADGTQQRTERRVSGWRSGLATSVTNPKLAVFFIALFPQFLRPHADPLLYALTMAATIVAFDLVWYSTLAWAVHRAGALVRPRVQRMMERFTGAVLIGLGVRLVAEAR